MAFDTFTALLSAAEFPFVSDFFARPILIPGLDNPPRAPRSYTGEKDSHNPELAQHFYAQNVMPTSNGLMSVGYNQLVPAFGAVTDFDNAHTLRDTDENNFILSPAQGKNYIYAASAGAWQSVSPFVGFTGDLVTRSYVNGRTFICYQRNSIREYNRAANTFNPVVFTGVSVAVIDGISNSNNYLIWWSGITVGWSSLIDPTDLTANINTGAGSAIPQDVRGNIRAIVPISGGFVVYTTKNAVAAFYTNNARAPFVFREISNAGGILFPSQVTLDGTLGFHYAWTSNGLQKITMSAADNVDTEATDFLAGRIIENFDTTTKQLTVSRLSEDVAVKVAYVSGRYLVVSYGVKSSPQIYSHAIINDLALKRWGKVRINHVASLAYPYPNLIDKVTSQPPKQSLAFLQSDGTIKLLLMDYRDGADEGVILLGQYQIARSREIKHQSFTVEMLQQGYPPDVYLVPSLDGRTLETPKKLQLLKDSGKSKVYGAPESLGLRVGQNLSYLIMGTFELNTAIINVTRHGVIR